MGTKSIFRNTPGWIFGALLIVTGILNMILVHPVPGIVYILLSTIYLPPAYSFIREKFGFSIPILIKIGLAIALIFFTLGVSDLGEMYF